MSRRKRKQEMDQPDRENVIPLHRAYEVMTVQFIEPATRARILAAQLTGHSETDVVNRAVQLYGLAMEIKYRGGDLCIREHGDPEPYPVEFL